MVKRTHVRQSGGTYAHARLERPLVAGESLTEICRQLGPVVYFIRCDDGLIKVGHTVHLETRKRAFGSGWEHILALMPGTRADERSWHERFASHLARGREYFHPHQDLLDAINEIRDRMGVQPIT